MIVTMNYKYITFIIVSHLFALRVHFGVFTNDSNLDATSDMCLEGAVLEVAPDHSSIL